MGMIYHKLGLKPAKATTGSRHNVAVPGVLSNLASQIIGNAVDCLPTSRHNMFAIKALSCREAYGSPRHNDKEEALTGWTFH
jgi:hypothetical protein